MSRPRIAVVAVHGIGEHAAGASAKCVADLLLRLRQSAPHAGENRFTSFKRSNITIPVKPAYVSDASDVAARGLPSSASDPVPASSGSSAGNGASRAPKRTSAVEMIQQRVSNWNSGFQECSNALAVMSRAARAEERRAGSSGAQRAPARATDGADHQFMRAQLADYRSNGAPYETVRYEGHRVPPGAGDKPDLDVHVYEMYWADLSRLGSGFLQVGYELFQLLFHIPHLGRQAVDHAVLEYPGDRLWSAYRAIHTQAVRVFTLFIPILWVIMAATILSVVPAAAPPRVASGIAVSVALLAGATVGALLAYRGLNRKFLSPWLLIPILSLAAGFLTLTVLPTLGEERVLTIEWIALSTFAVIGIAKKYDRVRRGATRIGWGLGLPAGLALASAVLVGGSRAGIVHRTLDVFEVETLLVLLVWNVFYLLMLASGVLGVWATVRATDQARDRARRVAWTTRATLAMATVGVLVVGLPVWALLYKAFSFALPKDVMHVPLTGMFGSAPTPPATFIEDIFRASAGPGLLLVLGVTALVGLVVSFTIIPSVWTEVKAPALDGSFAGLPSDPDQAANYRKEDETAERLGRWLSRGLRIVRGGVTLLFSTVVVGAVLNAWHWLSLGGVASRDVQFLGVSGKTAGELVLLSGAWLAASAVGLAALRGRLKGLILGFGPVLDAVLDVDNYLREHPRDHTPRARIAERYASLLRYLCKWRDSSGTQGYDAIAIVAHSQGTVISADYLGFIKREIDPDLPLLLSAAQHRSEKDRGAGPHGDGPALYLFTMGSPLRQLYSEAFPHLFSWVRGETGPWRQPLPEPVEQGSTELSVSPNPLKVGLERWVNAYRSGDYVGRALWRDMERDYAFRPYHANEAPTVYVSTDLAPGRQESRRELCIGAGAHTHYWDDTAKVIAAELDRLIGDAAEATPLIAAARGRTPPGVLA